MRHESFYFYSDFIYKKISTPHTNEYSFAQETEESFMKIQQFWTAHLLSQLSYIRMYLMKIQFQIKNASLQKIAATVIPVIGVSIEGRQI